MIQGWGLRFGAGGLGLGVQGLEHRGWILEFTVCV